MAGNDITAARAWTAIACVIGPILIFCVGLYCGYSVYGLDKMWDFCTAHFGMVFGIPMSIIASLAVVIVLVSATPTGTFTFKFVGLIDVSGPSVPIVLWIGVFLSIVGGMYVMSGDFKPAKPEKDAHSSALRLSAVKVPA